MSQYRKNHIKRPVATIDLHGYKKAEGIRNLTLFLEQVTHKKHGEVWVLVITGSGAHSPDGPVLRTAVEQLLQKRKMKYILNPGKGSFTVNANSGHKLFEPEAPTDTKVLLKAASPTIPSLPKPVQPISSIDPLPCEVAANDAQMEASRRESEKMFREQKKEEKLFKRAMSASLLEAEREKEEEETMMKRVLSLSMIDAAEQNSAREEDDEELRKALELSQKEFEHSETRQVDDNDDDELQRAIALYQKVSSPEDEELLRILEQSKKEYEEQEIFLGGKTTGMLEEAF